MTTDGFRCPRCGRGVLNQQDIAQGYCPACREHTWNPDERPPMPSSSVWLHFGFSVVRLWALAGALVLAVVYQADMRWVILLAVWRLIHEMRSPGEMKEFTRRIEDYFEQRSRHTGQPR